MLRVDGLERHGSEASRNDRMKICTNALLIFELDSLDAMAAPEPLAAYMVVEKREAGNGFGFVGLDFRGEYPNLRRGRRGERLQVGREL
jgi:hypothetical protein